MSDFDRNIFCLAGLPIDALDMNKAISVLRDAKFKNKSCFMTTPNTNFVAMAHKDPHFLNSVVYSDLVIADGAPIIWMAKLLGIPILQRVAGSNLFETLNQDRRRKMKVYFLGGPDGVAKEASDRLNQYSRALTCVGYFSPGFGTIDDMSGEEIITHINNSGADFLVVALGAKKGQAWILKNIHRITIPLVSHLGAVINFEANRLKRAPLFIQELGFEWLWRIKEEPSLWRRYWNDGWYFLKLMVTDLLPLRFWLMRNKSRFSRYRFDSKVTLIQTEESVTMKVYGVMNDPVSQHTRDLFKQASAMQKHFYLDLSEAVFVGFAFLGLFLLMKKHLDKLGKEVKILRPNADILKVIRWNKLAYFVK
jgi:N-acetylglucosaminyldiphosphoundecaprenol N-acetyl-beta-D-mannosaminyltransferase